MNGFWRGLCSWLGGSHLLAVSLCAHRERERSLVSLPLIGTLVLVDYGPTLMTSFNLDYLPKALSTNVVTVGVRVSTYEFWGAVHNKALSTS